jgi:hypothetical protein
MGLAAPKATAAAKAMGRTRTSKRLRATDALRRAWRWAWDKERGRENRVIFGFQ